MKTSQKSTGTAPRILLFSLRMKFNFLRWIFFFFLIFFGLCRKSSACAAVLNAANQIRTTVPSGKTLASMSLPLHNVRRFVFLSFLLSFYSFRFVFLLLHNIFAIRFLSSMILFLLIFFFSIRNHWKKYFCCNFCIQSFVWMCLCTVKERFLILILFFFEKYISKLCEIGCKTMFFFHVKIVYAMQYLHLHEKAQKWQRFRNARNWISCTFAKYSHLFLFVFVFFFLYYFILVSFLSAPNVFPFRLFFF